MTTDINMSLDDIIKKNKSSKGFNSRRKKPAVGRNVGARPAGNQASGGGGFGGPRFRNNNNRTRSAARFSPYKRGDIDSQWSHDLYEDVYVGKQRGGGADGTKIIISNLEFGVTDSDLEELFMEVGPLVSSEILYDKSGRSLGTGSVVFEERTDAIRAINQYNGIPLDGRPMQIEISSSTPGRLIESRRIGNFRNRITGGGGGGGGRRRFSGGNRGGNVGGNRNRRSTANLSAEQLDAELDEYRAKAI